MKETDYPVRPYGKTELAQLYCGAGTSDRSARNWLRRELTGYPGLMEELRRLGYTPLQHAFTCAQVRTIFDAIGEPD